MKSYRPMSSYSPKLQLQFKLNKSCSKEAIAAGIRLLWHQMHSVTPRRLEAAHATLVEDMSKIGNCQR